jgi:hypothetical protein
MNLTELVKDRVTFRSLVVTVINFGFQAMEFLDKLSNKKLLKKDHFSKKSNISNTSWSLED